MYWNTKQPADNQWHPIPVRGLIRLPGTSILLHKPDPEALCVDVAPIIVGAGAFTHLRQINSFGFTASASIFKNQRTILAMHRTSMILAPIVITLQATGIDYRQYIPRYAGPREARRIDSEVREHVRTGMLIGGGICLARVAFRLGPGLSLMELILGGGLADVLLREYFRAHGL